MLDGNSIHIWRVGLEATAAAAEDQADSLRGMLSPEENRRANAFRVDVLRREYVTAHAALRLILGKYLGVAPAAVPFAEGLARTNGGSETKPRLMPVTGLGNELSDLRFSLSHTHGASLIGVAMAREVGVDVEWQRPMDDLDPVAISVMSSEELKNWQALRPEDRLGAFFNLWTRKESYLKAIGVGLFHSLQSVTVPVSANILNVYSRSFAIVKDSARVGEWGVSDIPVPVTLSASVCWEGGNMPQITVQDLDLSGTI